MLRFLATAFLATLLPIAHAAPPTTASVEALLEATKAEAMMDAMYANLEPMMQQMLQRMPNRQALPPEQLRVIEAMPAKVAALLREEFAFAALKPQFVGIYQEVFEQEEIDAQLAFYRSPAGQALVSKMPAVMQKSMAISQAQVQRMLPRMQQLMQQMLRDAQTGR